MRIPAFCFACMSLLPTLLPAESLIQSAIGVTRRETAIRCVLHPEDLDYETKKTRVLLVGGVDGSSAAAGPIRKALTWFLRDESAAAYRESFIVSAVPHANPDGTDLNESFPPQGSAYNSPRDPEAAYLWRWIGMHAPDVVVDVRTGEAFQLAVPTSDQAGLNKLKSRAGDRLSPLQAPFLVKALVASSPCETGTIPAVQIAVEANSPFLARLLEDLHQSGMNGPSPARQEILSRLNRTPREVASQLSKHYGHDLPQVVYIPALALIGRLRLGELSGDESHFHDVQRIVAPYVRGDKPTSPRSGSGLSGHLVFCELAAKTTGAQRERYVALARAAADFGLTDDGKPAEKMPFHSEMSDALFMGGPILAQTGRLTGDTRYYTACINHLRFMRKLDLRDDGLYRHSPLDEAAWGRGNGFPALGLAMCLAHFPEDHPGWDELVGFYRDHLRALKRHQDPNGCWHQVIDKPGSYRELTSTCMITYAMIRGVRSGWLERSEFEPVIDRAWYAIRTRVKTRGRLVDVCTGTGKQKNLRAYYDRTAILGPDARGGAMALLVSTEMDSR